MVIDHLTVSWFHKKRKHFTLFISVGRFRIKEGKKCKIKKRTLLLQSRKIIDENKKIENLNNF